MARAKSAWLVSAWVVPLSLLAGCSTSLHSSKLESKYSPNPGVLYALPRATFDAEVTFLVTGCGKGSAGLLELSYEVHSGVVRHHLTPDPEEVYRIPYNELSAPTKSTSVDITMYPTGMIKSINSAVDDRTAQVMSAVSGTVINLFKAYTVGIAPTAGTETRAQQCHPELAKTFAERRQLLDVDLPQAKITDEALREARKKVEETTTKLNLATAQLAAAQESKDTAAAQKRRSEIEQLKARLETEKLATDGKEMRLPAVQAKLARLEAALSVRGYLSNWSPVRPDDSALIKDSAEIEAEQAGLNESYLSVTGNRLDLKLPEQFIAKIEVEAQPLPSPSDDNSDTGYNGIVYRLPAVGSVKVSSQGDQALTRHSSVSLPQFGAKGAIWLRNRAFDKNSVVASFNEDGSLVSVAFKTEAQAERAALAAQETSQSLVDLMQLRADALKAKADAEDTALKKAQTDQLAAIDHQIELLNRQRNLNEAGQPTKDAQDREQERLRKDIELEKLRQELEALRDGRNS